MTFPRNPIDPKEMAALVMSRSVPDSLTGCIVWQGALTPSGRAIRIRGCGGAVRPYRVTWEAENGPIPAGFAVDHLCRNPACVNPAHLRVVTQGVNAVENSVGLTAQNKQKTHCVNGHPLSGDNLRRVVRSGRVMRRVCRACEKAAGERKRIRIRTARSTDAARRGTE